MTYVSETPIIDEGIEIIKKCKDELGERAPVSGQIYSYRIGQIQNLSNRLALVNADLSIRWSGSAQLLFISQIKVLMNSVDTFLACLKKVQGCLDEQSSAVVETRRLIDVVIGNLFDKRREARVLVDSGLTLYSESFQCEAVLAAVSDTHSITSPYQELSRRNASVMNDVYLCMIDLTERHQIGKFAPLQSSGLEQSFDQLLELDVESLRVNSRYLTEIGARFVKAYNVLQLSYPINADRYCFLNGKGGYDHITILVQDTHGWRLSKSFYDSLVNVENRGISSCIEAFAKTIEELAEYLDCAASRLEHSDFLAMAELAADW